MYLCASAMYDIHILRAFLMVYGGIDDGGRNETVADAYFHLKHASNAFTLEVNMCTQSELICSSALFLAG